MNSLTVCCGEFIRIVLFVLNFIFWAAGGGILGVGIYVKVSLDDLSKLNVSHDTLYMASIFLISLGCIVFVVGLLGCCGSLTQTKWMLLTYFALVTVIFVGEIALAIAVYVEKDTVSQSIKDQFADCMDKYDAQDEGICADTVDSIQSVLHCCGEDSPTEWQNATRFSTKYQTSPPASCCKEKATSCTYGEAFQEGCYTTISTIVNKNAKYIGLGALIVAVVELLGMSLACYLRTYITKREQYEPYTV